MPIPPLPDLDDCTDWHADACRTTPRSRAPMLLAVAIGLAALIAAGARLAGAA